MTQLLLPREPLTLDDTIISRPKDLLRAFVMAADLGALDDKQAAAAAGMDPATWSRFKQGDAGIKPANLITFSEQTGNDLPLAYWALQRGYELRQRETETERLLRAEREARSKVEAENAVLRDVLAGRRS